MPPTWINLWNGLRDDFEAIRRIAGDDLRLLLSSLMLEGRLIGHFVLEFLLGLILAAVILQNAHPLHQLSSQGFPKVGWRAGFEARRSFCSHDTLYSARHSWLCGCSDSHSGVCLLAGWCSSLATSCLCNFHARFASGRARADLGAAGTCGFGWSGQSGMAIFLALWGLFAVGFSDNAVKAVVVARGANLPATLVFLRRARRSVHLGRCWHFLGPVILALCLELILWWLEEDESDETVQIKQAKRHVRPGTAND